MSDEFLPMDALDRLSRRDGVDTRPILVRVLTDLFVQKSRHAPEEIARYEELVSGLLDSVDVEARAAVARKLAEAPDAPPAIMARLIADDPQVCAPILARSAGLERSTLLSLAADGGPVAAAAIASRTDLDDDLVDALAYRSEPLVLEALVANPATRLGDSSLSALVAHAANAPGLAAALLAREDLDAAALAPLYPHAAPERRAEIRAALAARPGRLSGIARASQNREAVAAAVDAAVATTGRAHMIAEALAAALGLKPDDAARLAAEASGELFVMMLRAAGASDAQIVRAMLIGLPEIANSVPRFFQLLEIAETTPRAVAAELVRRLVGRAARPAARHEPVFDPSGTPERAGAARAPVSARRAAARRETVRPRG